MIKKISPLLILWLFLVSISSADGGEIYLPIITKNGDCMASNAILEITDGTSAGTIDLLQVGIGIFVDRWFPAAPPTLPTMQSSPLTDGSEVSSYKFGNAVEAMDFKAGGEESGNTQDTVIEMVQDFRRLLIQGINYQVVDWHNSIVYIRARASCETNIRYAAIKTFTLPEDEAPFGQTFVENTLMDNMAVSIERGDWLGAVPGVGECANSGSRQVWAFDTIWALNTNNPVNAVMSMTQAANGYLYATDVNAQIWRSINNGVAWAATAMAGGLPIKVIQVANGDLYTADIINDLWRSTDNGASWNNVAAAGAASDVIQLRDGRILIIDSTGALRRSTDGGGTAWAALSNLGTVSSLFVGGITELENGFIIAVGANSVWRSIDAGVTWTLIRNFSNPQSFVVMRVVQTSDGAVWLTLPTSDGTGGLYKSTDNGATWALSFSGQVQDIFELSNGDYYLGVFAAPSVYLSTDQGDTWNDTANAQTRSLSFMEAADGALYSGGNGDIYKATFNVVTLGAEANCVEAGYIANKSVIANLTHIKIDDGGAFSDVFPMTTFPTAFMPAVPVAGDAVYFGINTTLADTGPFSSLVFDIATPATGAAATYNIVWEYWDGAAWDLLVVTDNTGALFTFQQVGVTSVFWENPSDWATTTVDGIAGYWVRARVTAVAGGALVSPTQDNREIYSITNSHIDFNDTDVGGDIPALAEFMLKNQSDASGKTEILASGTHTGANNQPILTDAGASFDTDGIFVGDFVRNITDGSVARITAFTVNTITGTLQGGTDNDWDTNDAYEVVSGIASWSNRIVTGLRSGSRGSEFRAFINISDEQNVPGITVAAGTNAAFGADPTTPTGRRLTYSALAGDTTFVDRAVITMSSGIVRDYYGRFHVFIRGKQHTGSSGEITMRLQLRTGSGGITFTTNEQIFLGNNDWELLDFDAFTIPAGGRTITPDELGDTGVIAIQVKNDSGGAETVYIYDLVLIPTDEWSGDFADLADIDDSIIGKQDNIRHFLDIDSVRNPKVLGRSLVRLDDANESISANYEFDSGEVILQANADQRVWVLSAHIGSNDEWLSEPFVGWSVQAFKNQRYLTQRGSR
jgi:hypothetical protein